MGCKMVSFLGGGSLRGLFQFLFGGPGASLGSSWTVFIVLAVPRVSQRVRKAELVCKNRCFSAVPTSKLRGFQQAIGRPSGPVGVLELALHGDVHLVMIVRDSKGETGEP